MEDQSKELVVVDRRAGQIAERPEPDQNSNSPGALLRLALERDLPLDKIEKLMELQQRYEANEARKAYVRAMSEFKAQDCPVIAKDKRVAFRNRQGQLVEYDHSRLSHVVEQCVAALARHGFHHEWMADQSSGIRVTCRITHRDGHSEDKSLSAGPDTSGTKNAIQAIASTVTYLERYTLLMALGLAPRDDDDGRGAGPPAQEQRAPQAQAPHPEAAPQPKPGSEQVGLPPRAARAINVWAKYLGDDARVSMESFLGADATDWDDEHYGRLQAVWQSVKQYEDTNVKAAELRLAMGQDHR